MNTLISQYNLAIVVVATMMMTTLTKVDPHSGGRSEQGEGGRKKWINKSLKIKRTDLDTRASNYIRPKLERGELMVWGTFQV